MTDERLPKLPPEAWLGEFAAAAQKAGWEVEVHLETTAAVPATPPKEKAMTDETRCEPPLELQSVDGWHLIRRDFTQDEIWEWQASVQRWASYVSHPVDAAELRWRYVAPVTPPATVAALVEALERMTGAMDRLMGDTDPNDETDPGVIAMQAARAALALYRGEAGR